MRFIAILVSGLLLLLLPCRQTTTHIHNALTFCYKLSPWTWKIRSLRICPTLSAMGEIAISWRGYGRLWWAQRKVVQYIETNIMDYTIACNLMMEGIMENMLDELPKNAKDLHRIMLAMVAGEAKRIGKAAESIYLERRMITEYSGWSAKQVRTYVRILLRYEYLEIVGGKHPGQRHKYRVLPMHSRIRELLNKIPKFPTQRR